jgi:hypothetical protein
MTNLLSISHGNAIVGGLALLRIKIDKPLNVPNIKKCCVCQTKYSLVKIIFCGLSLEIWYKELNTRLGDFRKEERR